MIGEWFESDMIGIPTTVVALAVFLLTVAAFLVAGPVAGIVFSLPVIGLVVYLVLRGEPSDLAGIPEAAADRRAVLVVADEGLEYPALVEEVIRLSNGARPEVMIVVPVAGDSRLHRLTDDIDSESHRAAERMDRVIAALRARGITAYGQIDEAGDPVQALLDGLREFPANQVVVIPGHEPGWPAAEALADRVSGEIGVPVTEITSRS